MLGPRRSEQTRNEIRRWSRNSWKMDSKSIGLIYSRVPEFGRVREGRFQEVLFSNKRGFWCSCEFFFCEREFWITLSMVKLLLKETWLFDNNFSQIDCKMAMAKNKDLPTLCTLETSLNGFRGHKYVKCSVGELQWSRVDYNDSNKVISILRVSFLIW